MPDPDEGGFQKKGGRGLDGQDCAKDIPHVFGIAGPVGAELKFKGNAGDHPDGKIDQKNLAPELGHLQVCFVAGAHIAGLHVGDHPAEAKGQGNEKKVKGRGRIKLQA